RALPSGTITLLFTDIFGSTRLLEELGEGYAGALAEHRHLLRAAFERHGGVEVDTQGDAFFVAFEKASEALSAASGLACAALGPSTATPGQFGSPTASGRRTRASANPELIQKNQPERVVLVVPGTCRQRDKQS